MFARVSKLAKIFVVGESPKFGSQSAFFTAGSRLFETEKGKAGLTRWGVRVLYIPGPPLPTQQIATIKLSQEGETQLRVNIRLKENEAAPRESVDRHGCGNFHREKGSHPSPPVPTS